MGVFHLDQVGRILAKVEQCRDNPGSLQVETQLKKSSGEAERSLVEERVFVTLCN